MKPGRPGEPKAVAAVLDDALGEVLDGRLMCDGCGAALPLSGAAQVLDVRSGLTLCWDCWGDPMQEDDPR